jgi:hypothetical protein
VCVREREREIERPMGRREEGTRGREGERAKQVTERKD